MAKMWIEEIVERWNDERPDNFITMSELQKRAEFKKFCDWNGFDLTRLENYFIEYVDQQSEAVHLQQGVCAKLYVPHVAYLSCCYAE